MTVVPWQWPRALVGLRKFYSPPGDPNLEDFTEVRLSQVHKRGTFATAVLLPGDIYELGFTHATRDWVRLLDSFGACPLHSNCFLLCLGGRGQFINHSDTDFNVAFLVNSRTCKIFAKVIRRIEVGQEVLANYGDDFTALPSGCLLR